MRLIDADALVDKMVVSHTAHSQNSREASLLNRDVRMVMDMPTAYDVEKVVGQLEEYRKEVNRGVEKFGPTTALVCMGCAFIQAIDCVRNGGEE